MRGRLGCAISFSTTMGGIMSDITDKTPLRLDLAAKLAFPGGGMTARGLRRECARGRLVIERIAGKDFTTLASIERMRELCRVNPKERDSGFSPSSETRTARSGSGQCGSFATERARQARAALRRIANAPSES